MQGRVGPPFMQPFWDFVKLLGKSTPPRPGIAGMLIAPLYTVSAGMGTIFGIKAFAAAILGGIDSAWGVMAGGLVLGIIEALLVTTFGSTYAQMFSFGLTILVLTIKPAGLFGRSAVKKI